MKLNKLKVKNFRCYKEEFEITFRDLTAIIAKNDIGKSTILEALDSFFNLEKLESGDRSVGLRNSDDVEITCYFEDIPDELIIDTDNKISPRREYLLNEEGFLEIKRVYKGAIPKCDNVIVNSYHPSFENYNDLFDLKIAQLRRRASDIGVNLTNVNETIKSALRHAIWSNVAHEELLLEETQLEIKSTIWKELQNSLPMYQLFKSDRPSSDQDAEAQDPIKFAIKAALKEKENELRDLEEHVKRQVQEVTLNTINKLREMDPNLANQLDPKFSSFNWSKVFSVSLTNENQIPLNKRGSGVRRLFLINFFRAKAEQLSLGREVYDVIYAIEEPETSQHPNNQLMLLDALKELSLDNQSQVIFTTHNPSLAGRIDQDSIKFISLNEECERCVSPNTPDTFKKIRDSLGMFANHNVKVFVGVEGPNDIEFLKRSSIIMCQNDETILNLEQAETDGKLLFIPMGGSTLQLWTNRLEGLAVPEVHILDRDNPPPSNAKYQDAADRVTARDQTAFITSKREMENYIHYEAVNSCFDLNIDAQFEAFDDVPKIVAQAVNVAGGGTTNWADRDDEFKKKKMSKVKKRLNREVIDNMTIDQFTQIDPDNEIKTWLQAISIFIIQD